jgi:hypothetical protein
LRWDCACHVDRSENEEKTVEISKEQILRRGELLGGSEGGVRP